MRLDIKPLSVNKAWKGRRFKTDEYKKYERDVCLMLKPIEIPEGPLQISLVFGFSSKLSDFDNPVKPFVDCLQKKYGFNDKMIKKAVIEVVDVDRGCEFIEFEVKEYEAQIHNRDANR